VTVASKSAANMTNRSAKTSATNNTTMRSIRRRTASPAALIQ